ncbi:MAG: dihydrodipicolinate synthase family protein [Phycisphaerales bacterium]|jgi:dihydrodipicolinate synthase/N-acetylneuraminate lyase|nr:dihydrodipicolinate synthase family protein [Phycisphaerales bacterium]
MNRTSWQGVMPAITNPYHADLTIDHARLSEHVIRMADAGSTAIVTPGSLGEGGALSMDEKAAVWTTCVKAVGDRIPIVAAVSAISTEQSVAIAKHAEQCGCQGLMVLPAYAYAGPWSETKSHFATVFEATELSCMLYNNPIAYRVDVRPNELAELASDHDNLHATKESSGDIRRFREIKGTLGDRLAIFVGIDDMAVEGASAGADGWIAGLVNALPEESIRLWNLAVDARSTGEREELEALYQWFLPLLRLDAVPEFVHLVNLVQAEFDMGDELVRGPRRPLDGPVREHALAVIAEAKRTRSK